MSTSNVKELREEIALLNRDIVELKERNGKLVVDQNVYRAQRDEEWARAHEAERALGWARRALKVIALTPAIRGWLAANDPMALQQVEQSITVASLSEAEAELWATVRRAEAGRR